MSSRRNLYLIAGCTDGAAMLLIFSVTRMLAESGASSTIMGLLGGSISIGMAFTCYASGHLSDRLGRSRMMFIGAVGQLGVVLGCVFLKPTQPAYYIVYILSGAVAGLIHPPLVAALTHGSGQVQNRAVVTRVLVFFCLAWNVGLIIGQLGGGWLYSFQSTWPLWAAVGLTVINSALAATVGHSYPWPQPHTRTSAPDRHYRKLSAAFARLAWIANLGGTFAMGMVFHLFPQLMVALEIPSHRHGTLVAVTRGATIVTYLLMHRAHFWRQRFLAVVIVHLFAIGGLLLISVAQTMLGLVVGLVGLAQLSGYNYFASVYYTTSGAADDRKGTASGMNEATLSIGMALGAVLGGLAGSVFGLRGPYKLAAAVITTLLLIQSIAYGVGIRPMHRVGAGSP